MTIYEIRIIYVIVMVGGRIQQKFMRMMNVYSLLSSIAYT